MDALETQIFASREAAVMRLRKKDREYIVVDHALEAGEEIDPHSHNVQEWIILEKGRGIACRVRIREKEFEVRLSSDRATVISVPSFAEHAFRALSEITYTVLRET